MISGHRLVLLFKEPEDREGEAGVVTVPILVHDGHLVRRAPVWCQEKKCWSNMDMVFRIRCEDLRDLRDSRDKQVVEGGVCGIGRDGSVASVHEDVVPGGRGGNNGHQRWC